MSAYNTSPAVKRATTNDGIAADEQQEDRGGESDRGGANRGAAYALGEIDPETLPVKGAWEEVARRIDAWRDGRDGWRTGEFGDVEKQKTTGGGAGEQATIASEPDASGSWRAEYRHQGVSPGVER